MHRKNASRCSVGKPDGICTFSKISSIFE
jgi:hypothetical protein